MISNRLGNFKNVHERWLAALIAYDWVNQKQTHIIRTVHCRKIHCEQSSHIGNLLFRKPKHLKRQPIRAGKDHGFPNAPKIPERHNSQGTMWPQSDQTMAHINVGNPSCLKRNACEYMCSKPSTLEHEMYIHAWNFWFCETHHSAHHVRKLHGEKKALGQVKRLNLRHRQFLYIMQIWHVT